MIVNSEGVACAIQRVKPTISAKAWFVLIARLMYDFVLCMSDYGSCVHEFSF